MGRRCPTVISVHNLYPHGFHSHPTMKQLYEIFYERCTAIVHQSKTSLDLVLREFPLDEGQAPHGVEVSHLRRVASASS